MKRLILLFAIVISGMLAQAQAQTQIQKQTQKQIQTPKQSQVQNNTDYEFKYYLDSYERATRIKKAGIGLVVGGLVAMNIGIAEFSANNNNLGAPLFLIGFTAINTGIPLWIAGGIKSKNNLKRIHSIKLGNTRSGVGLTINF